MKKLVFVQSIPKPHDTGLSEITSKSSGKRLNRTKVGSRTTTKLPALYDPKAGGLANFISYNEWIEDGKVVLDEKNTPLTLQDKYERQFNLPKGYLTNKIPRRQEGSKDVAPLTYYEEKSWALNDGSTVFDLSKFDDLMGYYVCLASKKVANSEKEWRSHKWPDADFFIAIESESDDLKYKNNELKSKAFASLHSTDLTNDNKRKTVSLLNLASAKSDLTEMQVHNLLYDYVDKSSFTPGSNLDKFSEVRVLLTTAPGREEFEARYLLKQATDLRVVYEKQDTFTWIRPKGTIVLGDTYRDAIGFLLNPKKDTLTEELKADIKAKMIN